MKKDVTIRVKTAGYELEVTGPRDWVEEQIKKFVGRMRRQALKDKDKA